MAKQTFTTGQVLTAAQMTSLQQTAMGGGAATAKTANYVLVAADAGTTVAMNAAGSTTITVNTGLFAAGDTVFIQNLGAGACTITAGTATVATAGSLILPQNDAGILYFTATGAAIFYDYIQAGAVSPLTTKGDIYTFSTSDARLGVGANGTTLVADSSESTGLKWQTPSSGGLVKITTLNPSSVIEAIADNVFTSTYKTYYIVGSLSVTGNTGLFAQLRSGGSNLTTSTYKSIFGFGAGLISKWAFCENAGNVTLQMQFNQILTRPQEAAYKQGTFQFSKEGVNGIEGDWQEGTLTARDGIRYFLDSGTFTGKIIIYGLDQ